MLASDPMRLIGPVVDAHDAKQPERVTLAGRSTTLAPLDAEKHAEALHEGPIGNAVRDSVRAYKFDGAHEFLRFPARKAAYEAWLGPIVSTARGARSTAFPT